ncbi:DUF4136 domain-containing protein [Paraburkholderia sp. MMS20-SJTR3]|uniref:DUF4136 domain-containing protein n=1 Tax=Paraburkholderia sejongensis TaxID=2886946 RepID=A0ABS8K5V2_9BURK|nr:DUF4136 domain-containing protein [Paraburkholderia sp. MMS20-SJTR3]MCC8397547.1 DUF4136 domain-containing protein [Paraburkholderia sp. MMS20-SJTR3]
MAKVAYLCAALAAASLTACAGLSANVHSVADGAEAALQGEQTYTIARTQPQEDSADHPRAEQLLRDELARHGFVETAGKPAHYVVSIAYSTRRASIGIGGAECAPADCGKGGDGLGALLFGNQYQHALTLRFFDSASGAQRYKVNAVFVDRDADPLHALPLLMKTALAKLPFEAPGDWRVKLSVDKASGEPSVESMKPLQR